MSDADRKCIKAIRDALDQWYIDVSAELSPPPEDEKEVAA